MNADAVVMGRENGYNVFYGDTANKTVLMEMGLAPRRTKAVVVALDNAAVAKRTVRAAKMVAPNIKIFARARNMQESQVLRAEGAFMALPETIESSFMLGQEIMENMGVKPRDVEMLLSRMRGDNYATLKEVLERHK
jgi:voltage-gated potassium channel Kch